MGINGAIAIPPFESITVGRDGTLSIRPQGQGPETLVQAGRLKLVKLEAQDLAKRPDGLLGRKDGLIADPDTTVRVTSGFLEGSNVNAVSEMTSILGLARQFEIEVRLMRMAEENDESSTRLLQLS
jgi:flagellar basal-body rod protein FlgF